jgi:hypothetical protein
MNDEAAEFWKAFEAETGEKVASRCLGQYFPETGEEGLWGLLVLTDKSFRFRETPSDNLIFGLFKSPAKSKKAGPPLDIAIPLGAIASVDHPRRKGLARLFGPGTIGFRVIMKAAEGESPRFEADLQGGFIEAVEKAVARADGPES